MIIEFEKSVDIKKTADLLEKYDILSAFWNVYGCRKGKAKSVIVWDKYDEKYETKFLMRDLEEFQKCEKIKIKTLKKGKNEIFNN